MIAGLSREHSNMMKSGLPSANPVVVDRETDGLIEKAIAFELAYRQQHQQRAGRDYEPSFCWTPIGYKHTARDEDWFK